MANSLKLDHKLIQRILMTVFVVMLITWVIKMELREFQAPVLTDKIAAEFLHGLSQYKSQLPWPLHNQEDWTDGWGRPFYFDGLARLLRSAGQDGRFHSEDDRLYVYLGPACSQEQEEWVFASLAIGQWQIDSLPSGSRLDGTQFALIHGQSECRLPRLYGWDGSLGGNDDWIGNLILAIR